MSRHLTTALPVPDFSNTRAQRYAVNQPISEVRD